MNLNREIGAWGALMRKSENPEFVMACQDILALGAALAARRALGGEP